MPWFYCFFYCAQDTLDQGFLIGDKFNDAEVSILCLFYSAKELTENRGKFYVRKLAIGKWEKKG